MAWLRLDDGFTKHPKFEGWTPGQRWAWLEVMEYCARYRTDGRIPDDISLLPRAVSHALLRRAEAVGWCSRGDDNALWINDWSQYNPADPTAAARMQRHRDRNEHRDNGVTTTVTNAVTKTSPRTRASARVPVPSFSSKEESAAAVPTPAAADELLEKLKSKGWDTDQLAAASDEPERAWAWLAVACREATSNVGAYAWSGFDAGAWPVRDAAEKPAPPAACESCGIGGGAHASDCELAEPDAAADHGVDERGLVLLVATLVKAGAGAQQVGERAERWARERTDDPVEVGRLILRSGELFAAAGASSTGEAA